MRYRRLTLDMGDSAATLSFHERLTVIAGLGRLERESLVGELLGALSGSRGGVSLEVVDEDGRILDVGRREGEPAQVIEVASGDDVSHEFRQPDGRVDVLAACGLTTRVARQRARLSAADVAACSQSESLVGTLAEVDQGRLWAAADRLRETNALLEEEASAAGSTIEDAEVVEDIERRHQQLQAAMVRQERVREHGLGLAGVSAVAAIPVVLSSAVLALPLLAVTIVTSLMAVLLRRRLERARREEEQALAAAGARSYLGFHLQRVEGMLSRGETRERLSAVAEDQRAALAEWNALVGEVDVDWALSRRSRIEAAARGEWDSSAPVEPSDLAHAVVGRLTELRDGVGGRSLPLIMDEPFAGADGAIKHWLLELIGTSAGNPQIVYLTQDEDVAAWARLEALTGEVAVIEAAGAADETEADETEAATAA